MTSVRTDLNTTETSLPPLSAHEISAQLSTIQAAVSGLQQQYSAGWTHVPGTASGTIDQSYLMRIMQSHMANTSAVVSELRTEVAAIKTKLHGLSSPTGVCSGPMALSAFLLAISLVAIIIIVLASLGLAGVLPQVAAILVNTANSIWAIVSASIVTVICLISVLCVSLIRHNKPLPLETRLTGN
ncbi:hypothetical protein [Chlamydia psittaci]|uniref:hypothetical protein n=1 Tax=Chlamydia psittaci TaxID=83554 RepID=UPI0001F36A05|nr:hypothetical protein [Chlamydia psittaci]AFS19535.1 inclusion membrane protein C [Chlamydia psittaci 84/55]EPJ15583.1 putative inclusion membrane protein C [Chlamydia psittaci 02DC18]EPJ16692.1 putative inclusion membrane protein C [Chlamydia psittaci 02DC22]EPJ20183.1 putative inclusion membrane protein C [Chlamydia psittaci 02DC21]EPJ21277.1 putative inclusion membrane protein C [Chlamydia psittaci 02DC23]EPJ23049.1 putative inclusion membrane protein C [Chlamydia psittaci 03DC29]EPJ978